MNDLLKLQSAGNDLSILLVDDETASLQALARLLGRIFRRVDTAANVKEALTKYNENGGFDIIITDMWMSPINGFDFSKTLKERFPRQKIVMISGSQENVEIKQAIDTGIDAFLTKPIDSNELYLTLLKIVSTIKQKQNSPLFYNATLV